MLDHFIVGGTDVLSFAERGLLADGTAKPAVEAGALVVQKQDTIEKHDFMFTATTPLYSFSEKATEFDVRNQLDARIGQLCAMLEMINGEGFDKFVGCNDEIRSDYLESCAMMASECRELLILI